MNQAPKHGIAVTLVIFVAPGAAWVTGVQAQTWPQRAIRIIVPQPPGGLQFLPVQPRPPASARAAAKQALGSWHHRHGEI